MKKKLVALVITGVLAVTSLSGINVLADEANNSKNISSMKAKSPAINSHGTITGNNVNFRSKPSTSSKSYRQVNRSDRVYVLEYVGGGSGHNWYKVKYKGITGYIAQEYVKITWD